MIYNLNTHFKFLIFGGVLFAIIFFALSFLLPKQYSGQSEVLIMTYNRGGVDPYTQAKSAERIGEDLAQVMGTTDFYKKVMAYEKSEIDKQSWFNLTERKQRKKWQDDVRAGMKYGTSLMQITTYAKTKEQTMELSKTVINTLVSRGWEYVGNDVTIKPVNDPLISNFPARPNLFLNAVIGFILGVFVFGWWVVRYK